MLCNQCREREATVHFTLVMASSAEVTSQSFCDLCYENFEAERGKALNSQPITPFPDDVEHISLSGYLEASARASANGADKPAFKHISEELSRFPSTRQRLAFEALPLVWESLERGMDPAWELHVAARWDSIEPKRLPDYTSWLERIILRCFELRSQVTNPQADHGQFELSFSLMLITLAKVNRARFDKVLGTLKCQCGEANVDARMKSINRIENLISQSG